MANGTRDSGAICFLRFGKISENLGDTFRMISRFKHTILLALSATLLHVGVAFASGGPPMITDDPGTPGDGHWEINIAGLSNHADGSTIYQLPLIDANYGLGERIQLKYEMPWLVQDQAGGDDRSTAGNGLAGIKWRFYDAGEDGWQISTYPQVEFTFPGSNAARDGLVDHGTNYLLPLEFVHGFDGYDINVEVGRWLRSGDQQDTWIAGVVFTKEVRKGFELMVELHDEAAVHNSQEELILNLGARLDLSEEYTLLFAIGHDVHNSLGPQNTVLTYAGLQLHF
jgi:hypothetical protein